MTRTERATQLFRAIVGEAQAVPQAMLAYLVDVWNRINATTFRITVTMFVVVTTSCRYQVSGVTLGDNWIVFSTWTPNNEWLMFLGAMAGIDMVQFFAKRKTHQPEKEASQTQVTKTAGGDLTATHEEVRTP